MGEGLRRGGQPFAGNPVGDRLGDMDAAGPGRAVEIGKRARGFHNAVIGARRQRQARDGLLDERLGLRKFGE